MIKMEQGFSAQMGGGTLTLELTE